MKKYLLTFIVLILIQKGTLANNTKTTDFKIIDDFSLYEGLIIDSIIIDNRNVFDTRACHDVLTLVHDLEQFDYIACICPINGDVCAKVSTDVHRCTIDDIGIIVISVWYIDPRAAPCVF